MQDGMSKINGRAAGLRFLSNTNQHDLIPVERKKKGERWSDIWV